MEKLEPLCVSGRNVKWYSFTFPSECKYQNGTFLVAQLAIWAAMLEICLSLQCWKSAMLEICLESARNAGNGFDSWVGKICWEGNGYPLQYSCLENSVDRGAWQATVHGVPKSWTWLNDFHFHFSVENNTAVSFKNEHRIVIWSSSSTSGWTPKGSESKDMNRCLCTHVLSNIIHSSQNKETVQMSIS